MDSIQNNLDILSLFFLAGLFAEPKYRKRIQSLPCTINNAMITVTYVYYRLITNCSDQVRCRLS